jgi:hypothetical protein
MSHDRKEFPWISVLDWMPSPGWEIEWRDHDAKVHKDLNWDPLNRSGDIRDWRPSFRRWNATQLAQALEMCTSGVIYRGCNKGHLIEILGHRGPHYSRDWKPERLTRAVLDAALPAVLAHQEKPTCRASFWGKEAQEDFKAAKAHIHRILAGLERNA